jgi:uncharacterized protein (TIGR03118 family)
MTSARRFRVQINLLILTKGRFEKMTLTNTLRRLALAAAVLFALAMPQWLSAADIDGATQVNLVSNIPGLAAHTDPNLVNPWGVSFFPGSPFWVSDNNAGKVTLYDRSGNIIPLVVNIPTPTSSTGGAPTGQVANPTNSFGGAPFIFATEDGTITSWNGGTQASINVDNSASGAVYKGLAIGSVGANTFLYAANFRGGTVEMYDGNFNQVGSFTDATLPAGYAPFNVQNIGGKLYVTFALQNASKHDDVGGLGNGFVDVFDTSGNLLQQLVARGPLDSPWGVAMAPKYFGDFGGDLLVGNLRNGWINAFDPMTGAFKGSLDDTSGNPVVIQGLWDLSFGGGGTSGGAPNKLYFTAGLPDNNGLLEQNGLFGSLSAPTPEPGTLSIFGAGLVSLISYGWRRRKDGGV